MFQIFKANRPLRYLLLGQIPADFADWVDFIAITALLAYGFSAGTIWFALLGAAMAAPYILIGPFLGALVDRWDLRRVLIWANLLRAGVTFAFALAATPAILLVLVALRSSVDSAFGPAKQAAIQALTPVDDLGTANGVSQMINQASKVLGPTLGGGLLAILAPSVVFILNGCVSLVAVLAFLALPRDMRQDEPQDKVVPVWQALTQNLARTRANPLVWRLILLMAAGFVGMFIYDTFHAPLLKSFGLDPTALGLAIAAVGAGGIIGALLVMRAPGHWSPIRIIGAASLISGAIVLGFGLFAVLGGVLPKGPVIGGYFIVGIVGAAVFVPFRTALQKAVPPADIAKVFALSEALNTLGMLAAPFLGAVLAGLLGPGAAFAAGGALSVLIGAVALRQPRA